MAFGAVARQERTDAQGWFCRLVLLLARQGLRPPLDLVRRYGADLNIRFKTLWARARPVFFLTGLCFLVGTVFLAVSLVLSTAFFFAGLGALAVALQVLPPVSESVSD